MGAEYTLNIIDRDASIAGTRHIRDVERVPKVGEELDVNLLGAENARQLDIMNRTSYEVLSVVPRIGFGGCDAVYVLEKIEI